MHVLNLKTILVIIMIINIIVTSLTIIFAETTTNSTMTTTTSTSSQNVIDPEFYNTLLTLSPVLFFIGLCLRFLDAFKEALNWG